VIYCVRILWNTVFRDCSEGCRVKFICTFIGSLQFLWIDGNFMLIPRSALTAVFMCFVWISEQTAIISLYNINWLVFITETESVYCAVRTGYWNMIQVTLYSPLVTICTGRFHIQQFHVLPTQLYLCVLCESENKQRLFPYTKLTDWFVWMRRRVFTARYGLSIYVQFRLILIFKGLIWK